MGSFQVSVRGLAAIFFACALACFGAASADAAPLLWTADSSAGSISSFNSGTGGEVGSPIAVGQAPSSIAIAPNGRRAVVADSLVGGVTVVDTAGRSVVATVSSGLDPAERIAISPDGKTAYVTGGLDGRVDVVNVEGAAAAGSFAVGAKDFAVAFDPNGTRAYVGTAAGIAVVDTGTRKVLGDPIEVGGEPQSLVFSPDGKTAYVTAAGTNEIAVIDTALGQMVASVPVASEPTDLALSPDGRRLYASSASAGTVTMIDTAARRTTGDRIEVGPGAAEIALTPNGKTAYVAVPGEEVVQPFDTASGALGKRIAASGRGIAALVVAPDQSPIAAFVPPPVVLGYSSAFTGTASTDPDGTIATYGWAFGDGSSASGPIVTHAYAAAGTYPVGLAVVDNEGCGAAEVFTGRTAYCSGGASAVTHPTTAIVRSPAASGPTYYPVTRRPRRFRLGRIVHNRRNGTVKLQAKIPGPGHILLFGKKVHAVSRKTKTAGPTWLTIHARVELAKLLKKILRTTVRIRVSFTTSGGGTSTIHRRIALIRAPRHKHRHRTGH